jgi:hypothetical protein
VREKLELLEQRVEDGAAREARQLGLAVSTSYRRLRQAY